MRSFIAINLPNQVKDYIQKIIRELNEQNQRADIKWSEKENLHLTLAFLGDVAEDKISLLAKQLKQNLTFKKFNAELGVLGAFPSAAQPRVIKLSVIAKDADLTEIYKKICETLFDFKIPIDQRLFSAHITLVRMKNSVNANININIEPLTFTVDSIDLMASELTPNGPIYSIISKVNLN